MYNTERERARVNPASLRLKEHFTRLSSSAVGQHFSECEHAQFLASLQDQFSLLNDNPLPLNNPSLIESLVFNNYRILHLIKSNISYSRLSRSTPNQA